ncbi:MAG: protein-L-isoaspartate O-methyltransferase [Neisseria sp.]|nr:protein-L-isoaspartate O-methyltransferase [Neisseria sp.]
MDFQQARYNMVEQQIRPWDVLDFDLLDALQDIPREEFVSAEQKAYAYADMHLRLPNNSLMLEPKIVARLIQGLRLQKTDNVLEIGTGAGYAAAVMAKLAHSVTTVDLDAAQLARAEDALRRVGIDNVTFKAQDGFAAETHGDEKYQAIYIGAAVSQIPDELRHCLAAGGRLVAVMGEAPVKRAVVLTRGADDCFSQEVLFDTDIPALIQGERSLGREAFVF